MKDKYKDLARDPELEYDIEVDKILKEKTEQILARICRVCGNLLNYSEHLICMECSHALFGHKGCGGE